MQKARRPHKQARQLIMREKGCYISILSVKHMYSILDKAPLQN